jgi:peptidoglycan/LPS O-acetylase OafA/YrhL
MRYRRDIDGLRAIAVGAVVLYHAGLGLPGGYAGVDIFFVISGFLITGLLREELAAGRLSLLGFYERRARRILPALFAMLAASVVAAWLWLLPGELREFDFTLRATLLFVSNFALAELTGYFHTVAQVKPLLHTWSLAVEEQFYLLFPPLLWLLWRWGAARAGAAALGLLSLGAAVLLAPRDPAHAFFMPHLRAWELMAGALLALGAVPAPRERWHCDAAAAAGLLLVAFAVLRPDARALPFPGAPAIPPVLGTALMIWAGQGGGRITRALGATPLVGLGLISYSLYLWHWPVFVFWRIGTEAEPGPVAAAGLVALSVILAALSWRFVERPFRGPASPVPRRRLLQLGGGSLIVLTALTLVGDWTDGLPFRYGPEVRRVLAEAESWRKSPARRCLRGIRDRLEAGGDPTADPPSACRAGPGGPVRLIVWGDSHAAALQPAIAAWADDAGVPVLVFSHSACPAVIGFDPGPNADDRSCARLNAMVMALIKRARPAEVLIASRFQLYLESDRWPRSAAWRDGLEAALAPTVAALRALGVRTAILATVPTFDFDPPSRIARDLGAGRVPPDGGTLADHLAASVRSRAAIEAASPDAVILPERVLCPEGRCMIARDGLPIYGDNSHMTPRGAMLLLPLLEEALGRAG